MAQQKDTALPNTRAARKATEATLAPGASERAAVRAPAAPFTAQVQSAMPAPEKPGLLDAVMAAPFADIDPSEAVTKAEPTAALDNANIVLETEAALPGTPEAGADDVPTDLASDTDTAETPEPTVPTTGDSIEADIDGDAPTPAADMAASDATPETTAAAEEDYGMTPTPKPTASRRVSDVERDMDAGNLQEAIEDAQNDPSPAPTPVTVVARDLGKDQEVKAAVKHGSIASDADAERPRDHTTKLFAAMEVAGDDPEAMPPLLRDAVERAEKEVGATATAASLGA